MTVEPEDIINIGDSLLENHSERFDDDFGLNKQRVEELTQVRSRRVRNRVAGYVTRKMAEQSA